MTRDDSSLDNTVSTTGLPCLYIYHKGYASIPISVILPSVKLDSIRCILYESWLLLSDV